MNSLGDSPVHTAAPFAEVIEIEYMYKCMQQKLWDTKTHMNVIKPKDNPQNWFTLIALIHPIAKHIIKKKNQLPLQTLSYLRVFL